MTGDAAHDGADPLATAPTRSRRSRVAQVRRPRRVADRCGDPAHDPSTPRARLV